MSTFSPRITPPQAGLTSATKVFLAIVAALFVCLLFAAFGNAQAAPPQQPAPDLVPVEAKFLADARALKADADKVAAEQDAEAARTKKKFQARVDAIQVRIDRLNGQMQREHPGYRLNLDLGLFIKLQPNPVAPPQTAAPTQPPAPVAPAAIPAASAPAPAPEAAPASTEAKPE